MTTDAQMDSMGTRRDWFGRGLAWLAAHGGGGADHGDRSSDRPSSSPEVGARFHPQEAHTWYQTSDRGRTRPELPATEGTRLGPDVYGPEGLIITFPADWEYRDNCTDTELREWQALAFDIWHWSIRVYATLPDQELADGAWRSWLAWQCGPLDTINREYGRRARRRAKQKDT